MKYIVATGTILEVIEVDVSYDEFMKETQEDDNKFMVMEAMTQLFEKIINSNEYFTMGALTSLSPETNYLSIEEMERMTDEELENLEDTSRYYLTEHILANAGAHDLVRQLREALEKEMEDDEEEKPFWAREDS